jgi:hypothetical protein
VLEIVLLEVRRVLERSGVCPHLTEQRRDVVRDVQALAVHHPERTQFGLERGSVLRSAMSQQP